MWQKGIELGTVAWGILMTVVGAILLLAYLRAKYEVAVAYDQLAVFRVVEEDAATSSYLDTIEKMEYIQNYYPAGTKLNADSTMSRMVELERSATLRRIIQNLRTRFEVDFGDDPNKWITDGKRHGIKKNE